MIYYAPRFGLGNIIQTTPAINWLSQNHEVSLVATGATRAHIAAVFGTRFRIVPDARGNVMHQSVNPSEFRAGGQISEVQLNLRRAGCSDWSAPDFRSDSFCEYEPSTESFDVVIANGYNKTRNLVDWEAKTYPHWAAVVDKLKSQGLSVASVGLGGEAIPGAVDRTGLGLPKTFGLIKSARCFASNDTGLYHAAAAMKVPGVVLFTFSDTAKNHDPYFHQSMILLANNLPCRPCQLNGKRFWIRQKPVCGWACRDIPPDAVVAAIRSKL